jgi:NADH-quinone oxidoreductase subunit M
MILIALILIPFITATLLLVARPDRSARMIAMVSSLITAVLVIAQWTKYTGGDFTFWDKDWIPQLGLRLVFGYDGIGLLMLVLTAVIFPFIIGAGAKLGGNDCPALVNALLLFTQSALFGVFAAKNAFLFYIFYELSLIPLFFLLLFWGGGERSRAVTMRFFIYTLLGGLSLLFGIIYCVLQEPSHSADFADLRNLDLPISTQSWLFWALFLAFAIKLPIFPFHSWQPDTYAMAPMQGTMVLGGVLLKMGLFGVVRLVFPIVPEGVV